MKSCSYLYSIICLCKIILISSEKMSLHNNKYYVYNYVYNICIIVKLLLRWKAVHVYIVLFAYAK